MAQSSTTTGSSCLRGERRPTTKPCGSDRRRFLATSGAAGIGAALGMALGSRSAHGATRQERVIVVGAGIAGLMAASSLQAKGFAVTVVDARDRVGGRIWTVDLGDRPVDLGAQWIEGVNGNPLAEFCRQRQIKTVLSDEDSLRVFDVDGSRFSTDEAGGLHRWAKAVLKTLEESNADGVGGGSPDMTVADGLRRLAAGRQATDRQRRYLNWAISMSIEATEGDDTDRLSLQGFEGEGEAESFGGPEHCLPGGYGQIPALLAKGLNIRLGRRVVAIRYDAGGVRVVCEKEEFQGDRAVVTLPLGVLKAGAVRFLPELPRQKVEAISALGVGAAHKVVLRFPRRFWDNDTDFIGCTSDDGGRFVEWTDLSRTTGAPILSLWSHGRAARRLEQLGRQRATDEALQVVRRVFGGSVPDPERVAVTGWSSDPLSKGCYVNLPVGASHDHLDAMAGPVGNRLFFAGEATSRRHRGTVHGAWLSGLRAADQIVAASG